MKIIASALCAAILPFALPSPDLTAGPDPCVGCKMTFSVHTSNSDIAVEFIPIPGTEPNGKCDLTAPSYCEATRPCSSSFWLKFTTNGTYLNPQGVVTEPGGGLGGTHALKTNGVSYIMQNTPIDTPCSGPGANYIRIVVTAVVNGLPAELGDYRIYCTTCVKTFGD